MFECRTCTWRLIRAVAGDSYHPRLVSRQPLLRTSRIKQHGFRRHASTAIATEPPATDALVVGRQPIEPPRDVAKDGNERRAVATSNERHLKFELQYLQDRVKLAQHVHYTLRCDKVDKALDLVRLASKQQDVIVSWNHIIDWYFQHGEVDQAIKIYNEMKKRAQFPDGHTYSILLRGLSTPKYRGETIPASNVNKALSIYYSMSGPTSRVKANIIHTNNVLKVCKAASDMDSMWAVVSKLSDEGANAPDHITYAILLDAIRHGAFGNDEENVHAEAMPELRAKAVHEGRAIWRDVITKWRGGQIQIDEMLVIAMGKLLMMSARIEDWDDVLNLFHQTMNIPRQLAPLGSSERHIEHVPQDHGYRIAAPKPEEDEKGYVDSPATKAFLPVQPHTRDSAFPERPTSLIWAKPTTQSLSMLIGACENLRSPKTASAYWDLLTSPDGPYVICPELPNFHTLLKLLGKNRSSAKAVTLLREGMRTHYREPSITTFRIAMSVCARDKNNPNALDHARQVVDEMETTLPDPDVSVLLQYLNLALLSDDGPKIVFSINRLDTIIHTLRSRVLYGDLSASGKAPEQHLREHEEILHFFRTLVGTIDTLTRRGLVPAKDHPHWQGRRATLDNFITKTNYRIHNSYKRLEHQRGEPILRRSQLLPRGRKGMVMDQEEFGLRKFRFEAAREKREVEERVQAKGLVGWSVDGKDGRPTRGKRVEGWVVRKGWFDGGREKRLRGWEEGTGISEGDLGEK